jgi:hypothetical protein
LDSVYQITFGQAVWGKITDGDVTYASYKIYMSIELSDGTTITRFQDVSNNQNEFLKIFYDKVEGVISLIEDYYPVIMADEIYEDFDTYVTTTTTTYTYGVFTD